MSALLPLSLALVLAACGPSAGDAPPPADDGGGSEGGGGDDGGGSGGGGGEDGGGSGGSGGEEGSGEDGGGGGTLPVEDLVAEAAAAWCGAVLRCCDGADQAWAFSGWAADNRLSHLAGRFPPDATLDLDSCTALVSEAWPELWLGDWLQAHAEGRVGYDGAEAEACIAELADASCGDPVLDAMFDGTCFGSAAPAGGAEQRRVFERTATDGACAPIADGFGGLYYGSCDPTAAFCCVDDGGGCDPYPLPGDVGTCVPASGVGESCSSLPPLQLCQTGLDCVGGRCEALSEEALGIGDACYDSGTFTLLGDCADSWCDLFGSGVCEPLKADEEACWSGEECLSGYCDPATSTCAVDETCDG